MLSIGNLLSPIIFLPASFVYLTASQACFMRYLIKAKKNKNFFQSFNF